jgi:hypothetical protein
MKRFLATLTPLIFLCALLLIPIGANAELVGYWSFDENTGGKAYDTSGYGNDGDITEANWVMGKCGSALRFDGGSDGNIDFVSIPDSVSLDTCSFTISFWLKLSNAGKHDVFLDKRHGYHHHNYWFSYYINDTPPGEPTGNYLMAGVDDKSSLPSTYDRGPHAQVSLMQDVFYYVAATYECNGDFKLYLDGTLIDTRTRILSGTGDITGDGVLNIGASTAEPTYATDGVIDEVRIYNHVLTQEEIISDMEACPPPPAVSGCIKIYGVGREGLEIHLNQKPGLKVTTTTDDQGCFQFQDLLDPTKKFDIKAKCPEVEAPY